MSIKNLFECVTRDSAPEAAKPLLDKVNGNMGFVPNLVAKMANSPALLHGYLAGDGALSKGTFTAVERQLILLAASVENGCVYGTAAHAIAAKHLGADAGVVDALKSHEQISDARVSALAGLASEMVRKRGHLSEETVQIFLDAGYAKEQILEVLLGVAIKTISSYLDHMSPTRLDESLKTECLPSNN